MLRTTVGGYGDPRSLGRADEEPARRGGYHQAVTPSPVPQRFTATLRTLAMNYCVDVPAEASCALAGDPPERYVRVEGTANGQPFRTRLTPRGGAYRLFLDGDVRAAAGIGVGDEVTIEVARADAPPEPPLPGDLREALSASTAASRRSPGSPRRSARA